MDWLEQLEEEAKSMKLQQDDIFCKDSKYIVADSRLGGFNEARCRSNQKCPIFKSFIPYKSQTIVCHEEELNEVIFWCEFVQGGDCISQLKHLKDGKVAIRSNYMCW